MPCDGGRCLHRAGNLLYFRLVVLCCSCCSDRTRRFDGKCDFVLWQAHRPHHLCVPPLAFLVMTTQYQEALLETRRVLRECLLHEPDSVDSLWAAATVEGGVSLDPGDISAPPSAAEGGSIDGKPGIRDDGLEDSQFGGRKRLMARESAAQELMRVLGLSVLAVKDEELGSGRLG